MLAIICCLVVSTPAFAVNTQQSTPNTYPYFLDSSGGEIYTHTENDTVYTYTHYADPVSYEYDGKTQTLLGRLVVCTPNTSSTSSRAIGDHHFTKIYDIVDNGILESFVDMSNPYYITSVAKGQIISAAEEWEVTVSIDAKLTADVPTDAENAVLQSLKGEFSLSGSAGYVHTFSVTVSGPDESSNYNSRAFYYRTGYHLHSIVIYEHLYSSWTGIFLTNEIPTTGYEPTYQNFSVDSMVGL